MNRSLTTSQTYDIFFDLQRKTEKKQEKVLTQVSPLVVSSLGLWIQQSPGTESALAGHVALCVFFNKRAVFLAVLEGAFKSRAVLVHNNAFPVFLSLGELAGIDRSVLHAQFSFAFRAVVFPLSDVFIPVSP